MTKVFTAQAANANSVAAKAGPLVTIKPYVTVYADGDFDTATLILQASPDGGVSWFNVPGASWTVATTTPETFEILATLFRLVLSSVGASTAVDAWII